MFSFSSLQSITILSFLVVLEVAFGGEVWLGLGDTNELKELPKLDNLVCGNNERVSCLWKGFVFTSTFHYCHKLNSLILVSWKNIVNTSSYSIDLAHQSLQAYHKLLSTVVEMSEMLYPTAVDNYPRLHLVSIYLEGLIKVQRNLVKSVLRW